MPKDQKFTLTLKGPIGFENMEIDGLTAAKVLRLVTPLTGGESLQTVSEKSEFEDAISFEDNSISAKQFMGQKQPKSDVERVACLAFYLTHYKQTPQFKTVELTHLNAEAAQPRLSNASFTARNAVSQQYLAPAGGGRKQITLRGEALVKALPNRSDVQDALKQHPLHGKAKRKAKAKK
jgi:hypothetical protein